MERPTPDRLRDALFDNGREPGPDLWPTIRARLEPSPARPIGIGFAAGFALAAASLLVLLFGAMSLDGGPDGGRVEIELIDVPAPDGPAGDAAREEAARLLDARPAFLDDGAGSSGLGVSGLGSSRVTDGSAEDR